MKSILSSSVVLSLALTSVAFGDEARIALLKSQIRETAKENLGNRKNLANTRAQLQPRVDELSGYFSTPEAANDIPLLQGAWKEIFSDDVEPEPPGFSTDRDATYQVITPDGYFYNLANLKGIVTVLGVLRGQYQPAGDFLNIEFTKVTVRPSGLKNNEDLYGTAEKLEAGDVFTITPPGNNRAPNGPVGAKGNIKNLYIDSDFRVATGSNFADGKYDLYVLDKVTTPVRYK